MRTELGSTMGQTEVQEGIPKKATVGLTTSDRQKEKEFWSSQERFRSSFRHQRQAKCKGPAKGLNPPKPRFCCPSDHRGQGRLCWGSHLPAHSAGCLNESLSAVFVMKLRFGTTSGRMLPVGLGYWHRRCAKLVAWTLFSYCDTLSCFNQTDSCGSSRSTLWVSLRSGPTLDCRCFK